MKTKILVIKIGFSETLDPEIGIVPSLGDVVRTTCILWALKEKYPDSHITWLLAEQAKPLLHGNKLVDRILVWDQFVPFQLMKERFDVLINLEKIPGLCALTDMIDSWTKYGFRFDSNEGVYHAYEHGQKFIDYITSKQNGNKITDCWQKVLVEMLNVEWKEQEYIIGYKPKTEEVYDIGFNYKVGSKWPTKAMPMEKWHELEKRLTAQGYKVSWQQGFDDLHEYMDWIYSNRIIISTDSLGLHLALGFKKKVIALFGSTSDSEVYTYGRYFKISSSVKCPLMPCSATTCKNEQFCMLYVDLDETIATVKKLNERIEYKEDKTGDEEMTLSVL
ncbi:MAG: glycosyltransferase family 9 protein [Nitrospirae bacterium]|nr:glycosyltransferase family 9 protein [Nitrospirota bacterium]